MRRGANGAADDDAASRVADPQSQHLLCSRPEVLSQNKGPPPLRTVAPPRCRWACRSRVPTRACLSAALQTRLRVWPTPRRLGTAPRPGVVTSDRVTASVTRLCHAPRDPLPGRRGFDAAKVYWPVCVCLWCCCPSAGTPGFDAGMVCWPFGAAACGCGCAQVLRAHFGEFCFRNPALAILCAASAMKGMAGRTWYARCCYCLRRG